MLCQISSSYALHEWWLLAKEFQISNFSTSAKKNLVYRKRTLFEKSNFYPKFQFWQNSNILTSFSLKLFFDNFLVKSKLSTAKKSKTTTFFHSNFLSTLFSANQSWIFGQKMKISNSVQCFKNVQKCLILARKLKYVYSIYRIVIARLFVWFSSSMIFFPKI